MLKIKEDILKLYKKDIPYSLHVKCRYGEIACNKLVKSIDNARVYNNLSLNETFKNETNIRYAKVFLDIEGKDASEENIKARLKKMGNFPTNFKPSLAKSIYSRYCNSGDVCLDYSSGFGGRLLGCMCSGKNLKYIGFEPNTATSKELILLGNTVKTVVKDDSCFNIINDISQRIDSYVLENSIDFAFSCPPYFRYEEYCKEKTQSIWGRDYQDWLLDYVTPTLRNIHKVLKKNKLLLIYLKDVKIDGVVYPLIKDWIHIAKKVGFSLERVEAVNKRCTRIGNSSLIVLRKGK